MRDKIFINGRIYTVDGAEWEKNTVEAIAVNDSGCIAALGKNDEILKMATKDTEIIDLKNKTVLPGFIDSHVHLPGTAYADLFQINLFGIIEKDKTLEAVRRFVDARPDEPAYFGSGFNMGIVDENGQAPQSSWLDAICSDKPIVLQSYDMHSKWLNTCAMEESGITKETEDPPLGRIHRYEDRTPTGLFTDCTSLNIIKPAYTHEQDLMAAKHFLKKMNQWGFTSITSIAPMAISPLIYQELEESGELTLRINTAHYISPKNPETDLEKLCDLSKKLNTDLVQVHTAKFMIDGVLEGNTAWLKEPYDSAAGLGTEYNSFPEWKLEELIKAFKAVMEQGLQLHIHSIGDAATSMALDAQEGAMREMEHPDEMVARRNVITHLQLVSPEDFARMARLGNIAALQTFWHLKEPGFFDTVDLPALGEKRVKREYPAKSFVDAGVIITNSGDYPVSAVNNPFCGVKAGVIRNLYSKAVFGIDIEDPNDERYLLNRDERLTVPEMIEAYTINGAYQMFREHETGSLKKGKRADFIIVDRDPMGVDVMELDKINVLETVFSGDTVYQKI